MTDAITIIENIICFFDYFSFFYIIFQKDFRERSNKKIAGILICVIAWSVGVIYGFDWNEVGILPASRIVFLICIILYLIFDVSLIELLALGMAAWLFLSIINLPLYLCLEELGVAQRAVTILVEFIIIVALWIYYLAIGKRRHVLFHLPIKLWWIIDGIMCILTAMMSFFSYTIVELLPDDRTMMMGRFLSAIGSLLICIFLFILIYYYNRTEGYRLQKEFAEMHNEQQRIYFQKLLSKEQETRSFRHDIINDLLEMQNYCAKHDYAKLMKYLDNTLGTIRDISRNSYDVGNDIVNTVLNYYLLPLKENHDITVCGYMSDNVSIDERDLCAVCANLIKNAAEAAEKISDGCIVFEVDEGRQYLSIRVTNSFDNELEYDKDGNAKTTKKDSINHGIGLRNVKDIVKKYEGAYNTEINGGLYTAHVYMKK